MNDTSISLDRMTHLGPARVLDVRDGRVLVALPECKAWATLALTYGYRPVEGDLLLVAGAAETFYVIGVLHGRGETVLTAPGDLRLAAPRGRVEIVGGQGIELRGDAIDLHARSLRVTARTVVEKLGSVVRKVKGKLSLRAKSARVAIEDDYKLTAGEIQERAKGDVKIDGDQIRLG